MKKTLIYGVPLLTLAVTFSCRKFFMDLIQRLQESSVTGLPPLGWMRWASVRYLRSE